MPIRSIRQAVLPAILGMLFTDLAIVVAAGEILDKQQLLDRETFWDNRDWDWYRENIPFFECPDAEIQTTYYYRWELLTKHLTYGSPNSGYTFTEFIDRPFWSGAYGAISCPAGHQLYEARWLKRPRIARDFARYWFRTPGAQPRRYSTWLADAVWALHQVHPDGQFAIDLLPDLVKNYTAWEEGHFDRDVGLFWQTGHDDGMEININSRQTQDTVRGAPGYRPTLNSYLWADATAIARIADRAGEKQTAATFRGKAAALKKNLQEKLWDERREFFLHMNRRDEVRDGHKVAALSRTYQTGRYAGSPQGRELIGYVPWQFNLPDAGFESAWKFLMDRDCFFADYGPTTVARRDPMFMIADRCCVWSGQSWPYATAQTLKALANLLQNYNQAAITRDDYVKLLSIYSKTHRKDGRPYIAEAAHPDTGSWEGHDNYNHSEHYFHSSYVDLIITGLVGLRPRDEDTIDVHPLAPPGWDYFALDDVAYHGRRISIVWDKKGTRYGLGRGLHVLSDGAKLASSDKLERITARLPDANASQTAQPNSAAVTVNFAVNNDGHYFPKVSASYTSADSSTGKLNDGNYWYHTSPPNRWACDGSTSEQDWVMIDFGAPRAVHTARLYLLDDGRALAPPAKIELEYWDGAKWITAPNQTRSPAQPTGHRANAIRFSELNTQKLRATFVHARGSKTGLTELEIWGDAHLPIGPAPRPIGNLAYNANGKGFPQATASFTSRFDKLLMANDGVTSFNATPHNRWTSFESPNKRDWLAIDFGEPKRVARIELAIYDDHGGVVAPANYAVEYFDGQDWRSVKNATQSPQQPTGGQYNEVRFDAVTTSKMRVIFTHREKAKSGISEILLWPN